MEVQVPISVCGFSIYCNCYTFSLGFWEGVPEGDAPSSLGCSMVNFIWGSMEFKYWSILSQFPLGMILKTSSTYLFQSLTGIGNSGPNAIFSKYSIYMLATTGEQGEPIVVPCSCLKNLSWKVKTQFSKTNLRSCITSSFFRPMVLHLKEQPYLCLASGSSMCSVNSLLMTSKAVGTGMLVYRAEMSKKTNSSSPLMFTDLRWSLKLLLSLTKDGVIPVYLWRILVRNLASW